MKAIAILAMLVAGPAYAQEDTEQADARASEMQSLEADMAAGHAAVQQHESAAPEAPPQTTVTPPITTAPQVTAIAVATERPMRREGFTFELGLGLGGTNDFVSHDNQLSGVLAASIGGFLNDRTALLLHFAGASNSQDDTGTVFGQSSDRYHAITSLFLGPQLQWFPVDRLMLGVGVGGVARVDQVRLDIHGTSTGDSHDAKTAGGVGGSARAAFTIYQRQDAAAIRIGIEFLPSYVSHDWHTSVAAMAELQAF